MYYLQSRYYDDKICRFINADSLMAGVNNSTSGFNLYVYCFNNPIAFTDDSGNWPKIRDVIKTVKEVAKKVVDWTEDIDYTVSVGINVNASISAFAINVQIAISFDEDGNVAIQGGYTGGFTTGTPAISVSVYDMVTNAPELENLTGVGYQTGGSIAIPAGVVSLNTGADVNFLPDLKENNVYYGLSKNIGIGNPVVIPGIECHATWGETWELYSFNIFGKE
jgi:hypothetical protein